MPAHRIGSRAPWRISRPGPWRSRSRRGPSCHSAPRPDAAAASRMGETARPPIWPKGPGSFACTASCVASARSPDSVALTYPVRFERSIDRNTASIVIGHPSALALRKDAGAAEQARLASSPRPPPPPPPPFSTVLSLVFRYRCIQIPREYGLADIVAFAELLDLGRREHGRFHQAWLRRNAASPPCRSRRLYEALTPTHGSPRRHRS